MLKDIVYNLVDELVQQYAYKAYKIKNPYGFVLVRKLSPGIFEQMELSLYPSKYVQINQGVQIEGVNGLENIFYLKLFRDNGRSISLDFPMCDIHREIGQFDEEGSYIGKSRLSSSSIVSESYLRDAAILAADGLGEFFRKLHDARYGLIRRCADVMQYSGEIELNEGYVVTSPWRVALFDWVFIDRLDVCEFRREYSDFEPKSMRDYNEKYKEWLGFLVSAFGIDSVLEKYGGQVSTTSQLEMVLKQVAEDTQDYEKYRRP